MDYLLLTYLGQKSLFPDNPINQCLDFQRQMVRDYCRLIRHHNLKDYSMLTQKIITCVNSDLQADLTLKSLAEQLSVNASYLSTLFKKETGMPLTEYVNGCRIEHAQKLLLVTDLPIHKRNRPSVRYDGCLLFQPAF